MATSTNPSSALLVNPHLEMEPFQPPLTVTQTQRSGTMPNLNGQESTMRITNLRAFLLYFIKNAKSIEPCDLVTIKIG